MDWQEKLLRPPNLWDRSTRGIQDRIIRIIPEGVHQAATKVIEQMTRGILVGADFTAPKPVATGRLKEREREVRARIGAWRTAAAAEGGVAGAGGFLLAAADFPALIAIKIKLLFDIAAVYGHDGSDFRERLYILQVFQLAFSSARHRPAAWQALADWRTGAGPKGLEDFDWRRFQQEYRDYIDLAKLAQLIPVIGAPVGAIANYALLDKLGETAIGAYRMRWFG